MLTWLMAMLFSGLGSGFCEAAAASTRAVPVLLALRVMRNAAEAPLAGEGSAQV